MALAHPPLLTRPRVFCFSFFLSIVFVGCRLCTRSSYMTCAVFVVVVVVVGGGGGGVGAVDVFANKGVAALLL